MFRFTIRDVLWLTVVVGLAIALVLERGRANLWNGRGAAAFRALEDAELEPTWYEDKILVHPPIVSPPNPPPVDRYHKVYHGLTRPD
jgi:hypothetical protein